MHRAWKLLWALVIFDGALIATQVIWPGSLLRLFGRPTPEAKVLWGFMTLWSVLCGLLVSMEFWRHYEKKRRQNPLAFWLFSLGITLGSLTFSDLLAYITSPKFGPSAFGYIVGPDQKGELVAVGALVGVALLSVWLISRALMYYRHNPRDPQSQTVTFP